MSDVAIPDDVMKAADQAEARFMGTSVEVIAQAILAERERCATIAETMVQLIDDDGEVMRGLRYRHASEIASSIRSTP